MEALVVTLETAKRLKATAFPQERSATIFTWVLGTDNDDRYKLASFHNPWHQAVTGYVAAGHNNPIGPMFAAPTAQEIADQLPKTYKDEDEYLLTVNPATDGWGAVYLNSEQITVSENTVATGDTMAEALAALWLKLEGGSHE